MTGSIQIDSARESVAVWGLRLAPLTHSRAAAAVLQLIREGGPSYFITANTHYAMLAHEDPRLAEVNQRAAFLVADGAPLIWASRWRGTPLPERVAGSDLIYDVCEGVGRIGGGIFLLGGLPGVGEEAARRLVDRYPGLRVVGVESPPYRGLDGTEREALLARIREAAPDVLFVAFGQPKGELWILENYRALGVPVCVQVGASLDFVAGRVRRAPRFVQKMGMEWAFRTWMEPRRMIPRYTKNALFLGKMAARDFSEIVARRVFGAPRPAPSAGVSGTTAPGEVDAVGADPSRAMAPGGSP